MGEITLMYGDQRQHTPEMAAPPADAGESETLDSAGRRPVVGMLASALVPLVLAAPVLYFGVIRAVETGRALRQEGWHPGTSLPSTIAFSTGTPFAQSVAEVPVGEALLMVCFSIGMGCFLLSATLRALRRQS